MPHEPGCGLAEQTRSERPTSTRHISIRTSRNAQARPHATAQDDSAGAVYQRLLCQVDGRSGTELGFTTQPHRAEEAGTGGGLVGGPDALAALFYVAPLDTAALAAVCPAQARFYTGCVLSDPRCPPAAELAAGLARDRPRDRHGRAQP